MLGALAMIDDGELDWKLIGISVDEPLPSLSLLRGLEDLQREHPEIISGKWMGRLCRL